MKHQYYIFSPAYPDKCLGGFVTRPDYATAFWYLFDNLSSGNPFRKQTDCRMSNGELSDWLEDIVEKMTKILSSRKKLEPRWGLAPYQILNDEVILDHRDEMDQVLMYAETLRLMILTAIAKNESVQIIFLNSMEQAPLELKLIEAKRRK